jgi:hypothetical protein
MRRAGAATRQLPPEQRGGAIFADNGYQANDALPLDLHPGIDHAAFLRDPDGHLIQLYCAMEQIGWDGKPRPKESRQAKPMSEWPATLDVNSDAYAGEPFLGPWG